MAKKGRYVSRGGDKLATALDVFGIDVGGAVCADFGANVGGFTDCLLQRGAERVYAVDTGYGELAWKLRKDPRVVVMERTNALHCPPPEQVELVVIDMAWTSQEFSVPAAAAWLADGGRIVSLLKTHYERAKLAGAGAAAENEAVCRIVYDKLAGRGFAVEQRIKSPLVGKGGGAEYFLLIRPKR